MTDNEYNQLSNYILSPGNIYWIKPSGEILISAKNQLLNHGVINKLHKNNFKIEIRDSADINIVQEFIEAFSLYKKEKLLKNKIFFRNNIISLLKKNFVECNLSQSDLNCICWQLFCKMDEINNKYKKIDVDFFIRSQTVASSYTILAFLLGYYDMDFLTKIYNNTLDNLMQMNNGIFVDNFKSNLESIRKSGNLDEIQKTFLGIILENTQMTNTLPLERLSGDGVSELNTYEMTDLENLFCTLSAHYSYINNSSENILKAIVNNHCIVKKSILNEIKNSIGIKYDL